MIKNKSNLAKYRVPALVEHQVNPLICALPNYIEAGRLSALINNMPMLPPLENLGKNDRIILAKRTRKIRVPTKVFVDFYNAIYNLIVVGYEERNPCEPDVTEFHYDVADADCDISELKGSGKLPSFNEDTTCEHLILTGMSGVGKTALKDWVLKMLLPKTLVHTRDDFDEIQIVQIHAEMPHDGRRGTLLKNLFAGIDKALEGIEKTNYLEKVQPKLDRSADIGSMEKFFKSLCIKYHIGIIVIDEFQNIEVAPKDDKAKMRQLFDSMSNELNVPFLKIGTPDCLKLLMPKFRHGRRAGDPIEVLPYMRVPNLAALPTTSKLAKLGRDWAKLVNSLFHFQVINEPIEYSERWDKELYKLSCGIPYVLFTLWQEAQIDAIRTGKETLTLTRLNDVFRRRFKLIKTALSALRTKRIGQFQDLLTIAQLFDKNEVEAAIKRLNHFVDNENFTGSAATDILMSVDEIEQSCSLTEPQKQKLGKLRQKLKQRSMAVKAGQVYENEA
jgi:hypothetical protein